MSRHSLGVLGALLTTVVLAGCGAAGDATAVDTLPDGTYRVTISEDDVRAAGYGNGPGWSGTWTLVVDEGMFTLACALDDQPGVDCGQHPDPASVEALEAGRVEVSGDTVTFATRAADLAEVTGCDLEAAGCGDDFEAPVTATTADDTVTFTPVGDGGQSVHLVIKPWTRIS